MPKDIEQSAVWFEKSATQGHAEAQFNLGHSYRLGRGVSQNDEDAVKWYRRAAEQGLDKAMFSLSIMYSEGKVNREEPGDQPDAFRREFGV